MNIKHLTSLIIIFLVFSKLVSQNTLLVTVKAKDSGATLPYPEIQLSAKLHKIGNNQGELPISINLISIVDTLKVSYMGYHTQFAPITATMIQNGYCTILLEEKSFFLDQVVVRKNDFDAGKFYNKKKKFLLLPYFDKYEYDAIFSYEIGKNIYREGKINCKFQNGSVSLDSTTLMEDSVENIYLKRMIKRCSELNYFVADIFCHSEKWKKFYCDYKGSEKGLYIWEFTIRPRDTVIWENLEPTDELICLVSLDNDGFIKRIETILTVNSGKSFSYLLQTDYSIWDRKVISGDSTMKLLPNANFDTKERIIHIGFSNFKK